MFMYQAFSSTKLVARRLPCAMKYSTSRVLQRFDAPPEGDDRDDDEFIFPVQLSSPPTRHQWLWSGGDISRQIDLAADCFLPDKKLLYSTEKVKVLNVKHKEHGNVLFTLIQSESEMWKICNVAVFGDGSPSSSAFQSPYSLNTKKVNTALGSMLDVLNDKEQKLWKSSAALDVFSHPYQYICPPFSIKMADSINNLIKLAEGDRETYLPSCFKLPVCHSDEHHEKTSDDSSVNVKQKVIMQSDDLALISVDVFAYDRVGMIDAVFEMLVLLEQTHANNENTVEENNILSFSAEGQANSPSSSGVKLSLDMKADKRVVITSLIIGNENRKKGERGVEV